MVTSNRFAGPALTISAEHVMRRPRQACIIFALRGLHVAREDLLTPSNEWTGVQVWAPSHVELEMPTYANHAIRRGDRVYRNEPPSCHLHLLLPPGSPASPPLLLPPAAPTVSLQHLVKQPAPADC